MTSRDGDHLPFLDCLRWRGMPADDAGSRSIESQSGEFAPEAGDPGDGVEAASSSAYSTAGAMATGTSDGCAMKGTIAADGPVVAVGGGPLQLAQMEVGRTMADAHSGDPREDHRRLLRRVRSDRACPTMVQHFCGRSSKAAALDTDQQADGARVGRQGIRHLAVTAMLFFAACNSQKSASIEQQKEPLAAGQLNQSVSTAGQPYTTPLERKADVSPEPVSEFERAGGKSPSPAELKKALRSTPDSVLVGTDVVPLSEFLKSAQPIPVPEIFRSEQGGATAEIQLVMGASGPSLTRRFAEPGTEAQSKRYDLLSSRSDRARLSGSDLEVLGLADAILVWEKSSGVDGIPDSLWIRYDKAVRNGAKDRRQ